MVTSTIRHTQRPRRLSFRWNVEYERLPGSSSTPASRSEMSISTATSLQSLPSLHTGSFHHRLLRELTKFATAGFSSNVLPANHPVESENLHIKHPISLLRSGENTRLALYRRCAYPCRCTVSISYPWLPAEFTPNMCIS